MGVIKMLIAKAKFNAWKKKNIVEDYVEIGEQDNPDASRAQPP